MVTTVPDPVRGAWGQAEAGEVREEVVEVQEAEAGEAREEVVEVQEAEAGEAREEVVEVARARVRVLAGVLAR
ncbi:hypothetical protein ACFYQ5_19975 [Streptomyces sp. NPDC005794]|uniref:hypothetical protein n=1 Tax=Streptomyces sp. NPDC005794 TaxID=3364733 RepID=UPI0036B76435